MPEPTVEAYNKATTAGAPEEEMEPPQQTQGLHLHPYQISSFTY